VYPPARAADPKPAVHGGSEAAPERPLSLDRARRAVELRAQLE
jgi:hypothetical protein